MIRAASDEQESQLTLLISMGAQGSNKAEEKGHDLEIETHRKKLDLGGNAFAVRMPKQPPSPHSLCQNGDMSNENTAARIM